MFIVSEISVYVFIFLKSCFVGKKNVQIIETKHFAPISVCYIAWLTYK